jgi:Flp pilus assembly pilin Flp
LPDATPINAHQGVTNFTDMMRSLAKASSRYLPEEQFPPTGDLGRTPLRQTPVLEVFMLEVLRDVWSLDDGQDIAEYAVMLAVILVIVIGTLRLIGGSANNAFSQTASSIQ